MADTYIVIAGLYHLANDKVSAYVCGLDCGDYIVDSLGKIYVPLGADAGGLLTGELIIDSAGATGDNAVNVYIDAGLGEAWYSIPIVVGRGYFSRGQLLRPQSEADTKTPTGGGLGKVRRAHQTSVLFVNTQPGPYIGTGFGYLNTVRFTYGDGTTVLPETTAFNGVYRTAIVDDSGFDSAVLWQTSRPGPMTIAAVSGYIETADV